jgi:hypothetical protein
MSEKQYYEILSLMSDLVSSVQDLSTTVSHAFTQLEQISTKVPEAHLLGVVDSELTELKVRVAELLKKTSKVA